MVKFKLRLVYCYVRIVQMYLVKGPRLGKQYPSTQIGNRKSNRTIKFDPG